MAKDLHYNTTTPLLLNVLRKLMQRDEFRPFRLVGGTALSLFRGHRISVDIDLFTDSTFGSVHFDRLEECLRSDFSYIDTSGALPVGIGKSYFIGNNKDECIKLDLYYTDEFIMDYQLIDNIRLASIEEILSMKMDVISRIGRKKDYWDIHELMGDFSLGRMLDLHRKRYPYSHDAALIVDHMNDFSHADLDFDPVCLHGKHWEVIKLDLIRFVETGIGSREH